MTIEELKKYKILYVHIGIRIYRVGIFELLAQRLDIEFFWSERVKISHYVEEETDRILKETNIKYTQSNELQKLPIDSFSWQLLKIPFLDYKIYIFTNIVSIPFLLLAPFVKLFGKKIILFDELWRYPIEVKKYKVIYPYVRFLSKYCVDSVVTAGSKAKEFYIKDLNFDENKVFIAYNTTIDTKINIKDKDLNSIIRNKLDTTTKKRRILYLARIIEIKGLDILIKAMQNISEEYNLIVVGDGEYKEQCISLVNKLNLEKRVHFLGSCLSSHSGYYYKNCDLYVLPTKAELNKSVQVESWGFTLNEAMAMETPVVTTNAVGAGFDLVVDGETGGIAKENDVKSLTEKISVILNDNIDNKIGKNARKHLLKTCNYESNFIAYENAIIKSFDRV